MKKNYKVIIIGSGFGGICAAIKLQKEGINDFIIIERNEALGGTWYKNSYPGAAVDVPSTLYSFSFEHKNWSRAFAKQEEILDYTNGVIDKYSLREKSIVSSSVTHTVYNEKEGTWDVKVNDKETYTANFIINAIGHLSQPIIPNFPGLDKFKGELFHTSTWDHSYNYKKKKVALIGTGASGIQVAPAIAPDVESLTVFQRTPHWILPRHDHEFSESEKSFNGNPIVRKFKRSLNYIKNETRIIGFQYFPALIKLFSQKKAVKHLNNQVKNPDLVKKLTPTYTIGCKRILISQAYYPIFERKNVQLETSGIDSFNEKGILTKSGKQIDVDLIVSATGFHAFTSEKCLPFDVVGQGGKSLKEEWKEVPTAYLGTSVSGFPNHFIVNGPNTGIGHTSAIFMIESQIDYVIKSIKYVISKNIKSIQIKDSVQKEYNQFLIKNFKPSVWQTGGCESWYIGKDGTNTSLFPTFTFIFSQKTSNFKPKDHLIDLL